MGHLDELGTRPLMPRDAGTSGRGQTRTSPGKGPQAGMRGPGTRYRRAPALAWPSHS